MEKMIKCKVCGTDMANSAKTCPSCGAKNKKPIYKKWWVWAIVVVVIAAISSTGGNNDDVKTNNTETAPAVEKNSPKISKAEFEALETGITYEDAVSIIGGEGELSSQVDVAGYDTKLYMWEGEGSIGANANVTFQNNKLTSKAQIGLE